jgi:hypothetical protein
VPSSWGAGRGGGGKAVMDGRERRRDSEAERGFDGPNTEMSRLSPGLEEEEDARHKAAQGTET